MYSRVFSASSRWSVLAVPFLFLTGSAPTASAQGVVISEFMASNKRTLADENGDYSDWIELHNPTSAPVNLNGFFLTDDPDDTVQWRLPNITLQPGAFRLVWASGKNRTDPSKPLHTNFKLGAEGEYLGLFAPDGATMVFQYGDRNGGVPPVQQADVSYGISFSGERTTLLASGAPARATVPANSNLGLTWTAVEFNASAWKSGTTGVGFERGSGYESLIGLNLSSTMYGTNATTYIRVPFTLATVPGMNALTLRMKFDDGFAAYLNGERVASANAPATLSYNASATTTHDDNLAVVFSDFDITGQKSLLRAGQNVLAIHGLNAGSTSSDFLILPEIVADSGTGVDLAALRYFALPTPDGPNGLSPGDQGPAITELRHTPAQPSEDEPLLVTVRVSPMANLVSDVRLTWRVNFGTTAQVAMRDDGFSGDGDSEDGVYGATIPASAYAAGQLVRYFVTATDAKNQVSRLPIFAHPTASPEYQGTMVKDPSVVSQLPVLYWFVQNTGAAETEAGTQASLFFNGELYDNVFNRLRGLTSSTWPKKSFKFDMNSGAYFQYAADQERVSEINLNTTFPDKAYMRVPLAWETYANAGVPGSFCIPMRVQRNGSFYSIALFVEQPDEAFLTRNNLDGDGALYKMYNVANSSTSGIEKKTRKWENNADLEALIQGIHLTGAARRAYMMDHLDLPEIVNYLAATCIMQCTDHFWTNYYLYRDTEGNGEWQMLPWDKDLTFGRMWYNNTPLNDFVRADYDTTSHPLLGDSAHTLITSGNQWNHLIDAVFSDTATRAMYLRRLRTVMDTFLQPEGTPADQLKYEKRIEEWHALMDADVTLDRSIWGNPFGANQDFATAISVLKNSYLNARRKHLYVTHSQNSGLIPPAQVGNPAIQIGFVEASPASGNQDEEYVQLLNPHGLAVDISGWTIRGSVTHTFRPGTVVPANSPMYVSPNVNAFRTRAATPTGGESRFVQGDYRGRLPETGAVLELRAADGSLVATLPYTANDARQAMSIAAGFSTAAGPAFTRLNAETEGASAGVVDLADAAAILRAIYGL